MDEYNTMAISPEMIAALRTSLSVPPGAYMLKKEENK
jgi:hypothetical protein